jgi:ATP-dependent DNA ligase
VLRFLETALLILYGYTSRFPLAATAVTALPARSFLIDAEAVVTNASGLAVFDLIRRSGHCVVRLDRGVRDYLVRALRERPA